MKTDIGALTHLPLPYTCVQAIIYEKDKNIYYPSAYFELFRPLLVIPFELLWTMKVIFLNYFTTSCKLT